MNTKYIGAIAALAASLASANALTVTYNSNPATHTGALPFTKTLDLPKFNDPNPLCIVTKVEVEFFGTYNATLGLDNKVASAPLTSYNVSANASYTATVNSVNSLAAASLSISDGVDGPLAVDDGTDDFTPGDGILKNAMTPVVFAPVVFVNPVDIANFLGLGVVPTTISGTVQVALNIPPAFLTDVRLAASPSATIGAKVTYTYHCLPDSGSAVAMLGMGMMALGAVAWRRR